jgi:hypothetical protein
VPFCCPPFIVHPTRHVARHVRKASHHWSHAHLGVKVVAKIAAGIACMACPATTLITPAPDRPTTPALISTPPDVVPLTPPRMAVPGTGFSGLPPPWGIASADIAPISATQEVRPFPDGEAFVTAMSDTLPGLPPPEGSWPGTPPTTWVDTPDPGPSDLPVPEPIGAWLLGIGVAGISVTRVLSRKGSRVVRRGARVLPNRDLVKI